MRPVSHLVSNFFEPHFLEPHLNSYQLENLEELRQYLCLKFERNFLASLHLDYPDIALDEFSDTDSDQDAESFIQLTERKLKVALGYGPANLDALDKYTFRKKVLSSSLLRGHASEWY